MPRGKVPNSENRQNGKYEIAACPTCGAERWQPCRTTSGTQIIFPHVARIDAANIKIATMNEAVKSALTKTI